jgi:hypothetical protein
METSLNKMKHKRCVEHDLNRVSGKENKVSIKTKWEKI